MPVAAANLIGWWKLNEETAAEDVIDYSGNANDGTPLGSGGANNLPQPIASVPDPVSSLIRSKDFEGSDDQVSTPVFPTGNAHTLSGWIWWDAIGSSVGGLAGCHDNHNRRLYVDLNSNRIRWGLGTVNRTSLTTPSTGQWYHVAVTGDGSAGVLYLNAVAIDSATYSWSGTSLDPILIGARTFNGDAVTFLNGRVSDLRYYDRGLAEEEIEAIYAGDLDTATPRRPRIGNLTGDVLGLGGRGTNT
jgi:hypothetical protein